MTVIVEADGGEFVEVGCHHHSPFPQFDCKACREAIIHAQRQGKKITLEMDDGSQEMDV